MSINFEGVALHVADVEKSIAFYTKLPSCKLLVHRPKEFAIIQMGKGGRINLVAYGSDTEFRDQKFHMEIECDDIDETYVDVQKRGFDAPQKPGRRPWGEIDFRIKDPDGNILELSVPNPVLAEILRDLGLGTETPQ